MEGKVPPITEKVKFWEEQDKINNALIPRFLADHEILVTISKEISDLSSKLNGSNIDKDQVNRKILNVEQRLQEYLDQSNQKSTLVRKMKLNSIISICSIVLSISAIVLTIFI